MKELHLPRTKSVEGIRCPEQLHATVKAAPGLMGVINRDGGGPIRRQVARMSRIRIGDPNDVEVSGPGEIHVIDVRAASRPCRSQSA